MKLAALALLAGCGDNTRYYPDVPPGQLQLRFDPIAVDGDPLEAITEIEAIPGTDNEFLVANKTHTVVRYRIEGDKATALGSFDVPGVDETSDCGLLSIAFDPHFLDNRFVYFAFCDSPMYSSITRHVLESVATTTTPVFRAGEPNAPKAWHNIGSIGFDAHGVLWALLGDKNDPDRAQDLTEPLGSLVTIENGTYAIAAYGLRSPWRGMLDDAGRLWIGDVGDSSFEEVNVSRFAHENFGSGIVEGPCTSPDCAGTIDPAIYWDRSVEHRYSREDPDAIQTERRVVWVATDPYLPRSNDRYAGRLYDRAIVGDFAGGWVRSIGLDASDRVIADEPLGHLEAASSWTVGGDGYYYVVTYGSALAFPYLPGGLYRAVAR